MGLFKRIGQLILIAIALAVVAVGLATYLWIPSYSGKLYHSRNYGDINIYRDEFAIPHIVSENIQSSFYGLGHVHCQDRLWNMDMYRRIASGRMSELFGNSTLDTDIMMREFGFRRAAEKMRDHLTKDILETIQAYADGINDCVDSMKILPLEYFITGNKFDKWDVVDSLSFVKLLNFQLTSDWSYELIREKLIKIFGKKVVKLMMGNRYLFDNTTIMTDEELKLMGLYSPFDPKIDLEEDQDAGSSLSVEKLELIMKTGIVQFLSENKGSNGWAIHGNHTTTGKPILANDPHLDNQIPAIWAQAVLQFKTKYGKEQTVSGGSMPGIGAILSGQTNYFAWGMTTLYTDSSDLYQEKLNEEGDKYFLDNEWRQLKAVKEQINIKSGQAYNLTVKLTHRGPILQRDSMNVSFAWIGYIDNDKTCDGIFNFYHLDNYQELIDSLNLIDGPTQALSFATVDNHIGFFGMGKHPIRANPYQGAFIQDGTKSKNDWLRFNTIQEQPRSYDPPKGYVVTANNKFASDNTLNNLSLYVASTARSKRITQIIEEYIRNGTKISPEHVMNMQRDVKDSYAEKIHKHYLNIYHKNKKDILTSDQISQCDEMMNLLASWDFYAEENSTGASVYYAIDYFLSKKLLLQYSDDVLVRLKVTVHFIFDHFRLNQIQNWSEGKSINEEWCRNTNSTLKGKDCIYNFIISINEAYLFLKEKLGGNMQKWFYGELHQHHFIHIPFSKTPLKSLFERSYKSKGSKYTVHVSALDFQNDSWKGIWGGNYKMIASLDQSQDSYFILDTGVSGNFLSPHYDDQQQVYKQGNYLKQNRNPATYTSFQKYSLISSKPTKSKQDL
ncbi:hypothetical protein ABPG74_019478 [Tetrahymena malaccensis]